MNRPTRPPALRDTVANDGDVDVFTHSLRFADTLGVMLDPFIHAASIFGLPVRSGWRDEPKFWQMLLSFMSWLARILWLLHPSKLGLAEWPTGELWI